MTKSQTIRLINDEIDKLIIKGQFCTERCKELRKYHKDLTSTK